MSIQTTKTVLQDFLSSAEPNVLALTGAWGTGKTHAWREALNTNKGKLKFKHYCYVSLFGINSMAELRMALFTKTIATSTLEEKIDFEKLNQHWASITKNWLKTQYARFGPMMKDLPYGSSLSLGLEALAPSTVHDTLVCFDDFERQTTIKAEEVLGLITELSEERGCKVALIFNANQLGEKSAAYLACREKVVDLEVNYAPTVQEAFELVFEASTPSRDIVLRHVVDLEITNVRILRKLNRLIRRILPVTAGMHSKVIEASIATTVLLCWCAYAPDVSKPKIEEIQNWNKELFSSRKTEERDPVVLAWVRRLKAYGFLQVDDLDLAIAHIVERGYVEGTGFAEAASTKNEELRGQAVSERFAVIWRNFHGSFANDQDAFIKELFEAALQAMDGISTNDLNGTVRLLRDLKRDDLADELIGKFVESNKARPSTFDLKNHPFGGTIDDVKLRDVFNAVHTDLVKLPELEEAVIFMAKNSGYNVEHLDAMKRASVDEYHAMFLKKHENVELSSLIKWSLRWADSEHAEIAIKAKEALERIKVKNLLTSIQVGRYGV